jgi:hypothetical protein
LADIAGCGSQFVVGTGRVAAKFEIMLLEGGAVDASQTKINVGHKISAIHFLTHHFGTP